MNIQITDDPHLKEAQKYVTECKKESYTLKIPKGVIVTTNPEKWEVTIKTLNKHR